MDIPASQQTSSVWPITERELKNKLQYYAMTQDQLDAVSRIDTSNVKPEEYALIQNYNSLIMYQNIKDTKDYEAAVMAAKEEGVGSYQPTEEYTTSEYIPPSELIPPYKAADTGAVYDIFKGKTDSTTYNDSEYLFTEEGLIPLSEEGARLARRYSINKETPLEVMFNLQGDQEYYGGTNNFRMPQFLRQPGKELDLPPGVVQGIPKGEDPSNYISVGEVTSTDGKIGGGDPYLYIKILDRPKHDVTHTRDVGEPIPIYPSMPDPPEKRMPIAIEGTVPLPPVEEKNVIEEGRKRVIEDIDPIVIPEQESITAPVNTDEPSVKDSEGRKPKDRLFMANLFANIAKGLEGWNIKGVNLPVPSYDQPRYQSGEIGQAVQNLYRGR